MDNPLELPAPTDPVARVHEFARDLAYGAVHGFWTTRFRQKTDLRISTIDSGNDLLDIVLRNKWNNNPPRISLLESFGYVSLYVKESDSRFSLTMRAFSLLDVPVNPLKVFVSYTRKESSEFSLLVEARLKLTDERIDVFVDKNLVPGDEWHGELESKVQWCDYFICLIGAETLNSPHVCQEIEWALESDCRVITIIHPDLKFDDIRNLNDNSKRIFPILEKKQLIVVENKSAKYYDLAIRDLLNALGYSTL